MPKTAAGLAAYAKAQLGQPYIYATFGQVLTQELLDYKRRQYPAMTTAERAKKAKVFIGKRTYDCAGLIKAYLWSDTPTGTPKYSAAQDKSANGLRSLSKASKDFSAMPDTPGLLVFFDGHVGVYIGNGQVVEARGFNYGVVQTALKARPWTHWGRCPWVEYPSATAKTTASMASQGAIKVGDRVRVRCVGIPYYPGEVKIPEWLDGKIYTVNGLDKRGGVDCARLKEITTWCAVTNLMKV